MPTSRNALMAAVLALVLFSATGCVMHRTVKEGDEVVAQGLVVKSPLISP
jgi:hypothetical protein